MRIFFKQKTLKYVILVIKDEY